MTWTYDPTCAASLDQVRFLCGDTVEASSILQDEEIAFALTQQANPYRAAALVCRALAAKYAPQVDKHVGDLWLMASQRQKAYLDLAKQFETQAARSGAGPLVGGISVSEKRIDRDDTDKVQPSFRRKMLSNPEGSTDRLRPFGNNEEI